MKIILVNKKEIKLYNGNCIYDLLVKFSASEFKFDPKTIQLTFKDEEGDMITILSDQDLQVMQAVFQGKQYLKINVQGSELKPVEEVKEVLKTEISENVSAPVPEEKKSQQKMEKGKEQEGRCSREKGWKGHGWGGWGCWGRKRHGSSSKDKSPRHGSGHKKEKLMKMKGFFNEVVAKLVDERITHMLPCIKERIQNGEEPLQQIVSDLVHNGYNCKGCQMNPIKGIRYQCYKCANFNLCQTCEDKIEHEHPLLKIKKIMEESDGKEDFRFFKKLFKQYFKSPHKRGESSSQEKGGRKGNCFYKKIWGLALIFGGEPEQYKEYAEKHPDKRPKDVFKQYASDNGIPEAEFNEKFTNFRVQKLAKCFGNPAEKYKQFVSENLELNQKELMDKLYETGLENKENKKCWWGRRFNFNQAKEETINEVPPEVSPKRQKKSKRKEKSNSKEKRKQKKRDSPSSEEPKPVDTAEVVKAKGAILMKMNEIFGKENQKRHMKFIDRFFPLGQERIIDLWIQQ